MSLIRVTAPSSLGELLLSGIMDHLRRTLSVPGEPVAEVPDQAYILELANAAVDFVEAKLRRALITQHWQLLIDDFPVRVALPVPPLQAVTSVRYVDTTGAWQTVPNDAFRVTGAGSWCARIEPAEGHFWPSSQRGTGSVEIRFRAGYGDTADDVPGPIRQAIRELVGHWYLNREAVAFSTPHEVPFTVSDLLAPFRIFAHGKA